MGKTIIVYLGIFGIITAALTGAKAENVQYDRKLDIQRQQIAELKGRVEVCMNEGSRQKLMQGSRNREDITQFTITTCGRALLALLMKSGLSNTSAVTELINMADEQLDEVTSGGQ